MGDCPSTGGCQQVASPSKLFKDATEFGLKYDRNSDEHSGQTVLNQPVKDGEVQHRPYDTGSKKDDQHAPNKLVRLRPADQYEKPEQDERHDRDIKNREWRYLAE